MARAKVKVKVKVACKERSRHRLQKMSSASCGTHENYDRRRESLSPQAVPIRDSECDRPRSVFWPLPVRGEHLNPMHRRRGWLPRGRVRQRLLSAIEIVL